MTRLVLFFSFVFVMSGQAQWMTNSGQQFFIGSAGLVHIEGSFQNTDVGTSVNNGLLYIDSNIVINNASLQKGSGSYFIGGDWLNSGHFNCDSSIVYLTGGIQFVRGDSITSFYNLDIGGTNRKELGVTIHILNSLQLRNLELATNNDTLYIDNSNPNTMHNDTLFGAEGYISSKDSGGICIKTFDTLNYFLPLGASLPARIYRPIMVASISTSAQQFVCSFVNSNPGNYGYSTSLIDTNVCAVNSNFFHRIYSKNRSSNFGIILSYNPLTDGLWDQIGNWNNHLWLNTDQGKLTHIGRYTAIERFNLDSNYSRDFALLKTRPIIDEIKGSDQVCMHQAVQYSVPIYSDARYNWSVNGWPLTQIATQTNTINHNNNEIAFTWNNPGIQILSVQVTDTITGCSSNSYSTPVNVSTLPIAKFTESFTNLYQNSVVAFLDSSINAVNYYWNFGNSETSDLKYPKTSYLDTGTFTIQEIVFDSKGCSDTSSQAITILPGLNIPNVFTPNGDGVNDIFLIQAIGVSMYFLQIFDRDGILIYFSNGSTAAWDGRTFSGQECPAGTYYYVMQTTLRDIKNEYKGFVELLR